MCECASALCGHSCGTAGTGSIHGSACDGRTAHACFGVCHRSVARVAAGGSWTSITYTGDSVWAGRYGHTTVIDAAGTIYVIGGFTHSGGGSSTYHQDVWKSTVGGADRSQSRLLEGYWVGTRRVLSGGLGGVRTGVLAGAGCITGYPEVHAPARFCAQSPALSGMSPVSYSHTHTHTNTRARTPAFRTFIGVALSPS